jgi:tyrosyl-tRNA synthetase
VQNVDTNPIRIKEILRRGVYEIVSRKELEGKLLSGKQLHLKLGIDVTGPLIHLGHSVIQRKIRDFQELGHKVTLIIGDFTTLVGDHSDKVDMRDERDHISISKDEETYKDQFFKTVLKENTEVRHNSEWLSQLDFNDVIGLAKVFTVGQMLEREAFNKRFTSQKPIGLDELLYPLMQGYDSIALKCDVEFGGTDQIFNLLAGRKLMEAKGLVPQNTLAMNLLTGSDGRPMGKSLKNYIPVNDSPNDMFGKLMSIVDEVIFDYFELVTRVPMEDIEGMKQEVANGANPMAFKKELALNIVEFYHGKEEALKAQDHFQKTVQNKEVEMDDLLDITVKTNTSTILDVLKEDSGLSSGDLKRLITQGGVEIDGVKITDYTKSLELKSGMLIKVGKRKYFRVNLHQ